MEDNQTIKKYCNMAACTIVVASFLATKYFGYHYGLF